MGTAQLCFKGAVVTRGSQLLEQLRRLYHSLEEEERKAMKEALRQRFDTMNAEEAAQSA